MAVGFVGTLLGGWRAAATRLPEPFVIQIARPRRPLQGGVARRRGDRICLSS